MRFLLLFLALIAAVWVLRLVQRSRQGPPARPGGRGVDVVKCEYCGVHIPKTEAFADGARFFCSREHRNAIDRRPDEEA